MEAKVKRSVATIRAVFIASLLWAAGLAQAIDIAGVQLADLSHYAAESLHSEASHSSKNFGIVVIAYTADLKSAESFCHLAAPYKKSGAVVRSVLRAAPAPGKTFDLYYNGASYVRANKNAYPPTDDFGKVLAWAVDLQSVDLRLAAKQREADALEKEIEALDRKIDAHDRVLELSRDPDINK